MLRFGKLDGAMICEIIDAESETEDTPENFIRITDDAVEVGWHYNEDTFIPPPPDETYMLSGTTWVQNLDTVRDRTLTNELTIYKLAKMIILELEALRKGDARIKEIDDYFATIKSCVCV